MLDSFFKELANERKYDSFLDEHRRIVWYGKVIVTKIKNQDRQVWKFALSLLISALKLKLRHQQIVTGLKIYNKQQGRLEILEYDKTKILTIEQTSKDKVIKRTTIKKKRSTYWHQYAQIEYVVWFKAPTTQFGLTASINKYLIKKREKIRAANLGMAICKKFDAKPTDWVKKYAQK